MIGNKKIKVCGMRYGENIAEVDALGVDMIGFIFYPQSPRYVAKVPSAMPQMADRVGVFVDDSLGSIEEKAKLFRLDYLQLHGSESVQFTGEVAQKGLKVIKAFSVDEEFDFETVEPYAQHCSLFIFDTKCQSVGGSGRSFDWQLLQRYKGSTPFLLSGGISLENITEVTALNHPQLIGYDINSCFETEPARKSVERVGKFLNQLKK